MKGTVKWFNIKKGFGFLVAEDGTEHFIHHTSLQMQGRKVLHTDDIVGFEVGIGSNGKEQAVNVTPIVTIKMIEKALKEDNLYIRTMKDSHGVKKYLVVNVDNVIQSSEGGMTFSELADYAEMTAEISALY